MPPITETYLRYNFCILHQQQHWWTTGTTPCLDVMNRHQLLSIFQEMLIFQYMEHFVGLVSSALHYPRQQFLQTLPFPELFNSLPFACFKWIRTTIKMNTLSTDTVLFASTCFISCDTSGQGLKPQKVGIRKSDKDGTKKSRNHTQYFHKLFQNHCFHVRKSMA